MNHSLTLCEFHLNPITVTIGARSLETREVSLTPTFNSFQWQLQKPVTLSSTSGMGFPDSSDLGPAFKAPNPGSRCSSGFETFGPKWSTFWNCKGWTPLSFFSSQFSLQTKFTLLPLDGVLALPLRCFDNHEMLREKVKKTNRQKELPLRFDDDQEFFTN